MKKLSLKAGGIKEMLTKDQMKKVVGGDGGSIDCVHDWYYWYCTECPTDFCHEGPGWLCHTVNCTNPFTGERDAGSWCCPPGTF